MKALIAMSGGVDSSVAALLAMRMGYECVGVTMKLFTNEDANESDDRPCCSLSGAADAARVCNKLGISHYVFDFADDFREDVIERFVRSYERGETPNPCIDCNTFLKFGKLLDRAIDMGFDKVVTGHYAAIREEDGRYLLVRAADKNKDQTYFLYSMTQDQLKHIDFPLGDLTKAEVRDIATEAGFVNAKKAESQDICFVTDGKYSDFIDTYRGDASPPGFFVDKEGRKLGEHRGITHYTIGQRKGLGIALGHPVFVKEICPGTNEIILSDAEDVFVDCIEITDINWIKSKPDVEKIRTNVAIRYGAKPSPAILYPDHVLNKAVVEFNKPVRAPSKGQAAVMYENDAVVGGGRICKTDANLDRKIPENIQ